MKFYGNKLITILFFYLTLSLALTVQAQKMTAEDIVAKHLDSIGGKENLAAVKNQLIFSDVEFKVRGSAAVLNGKGLILSSGEKISGE
ncbi:MAG TPA: hypothetical protein VF556_06725 [Pyrinomonadaceae bacterium]|jgi:hypothetical protein